MSDQPTVEIAKMVLVGKENKDIVLRINRAGSRRSGSAATTAPVHGRASSSSPSGADIGFVGDIERVDVDVLNHIAEDYIPVIASVGADTRGQLLQRQRRRRRAARSPQALGAYKVVFLTDVRGLARRRRPS